MALNPVQAWALLVAVTLTTGFLAMSGVSARVAATSVILIAAIKINLVIGQFMELRWQHTPFRQVLAVWLAVATAIIIIGYWAA